MAISVRLNGAAGRDPVRFDAAALAMLRRTLEFCRWSEGAHGPLGGVLYELWQRSLPPPAALLAARETSGCDRLAVDEEAGTAALAAGSRVDLRGFATGWAVDRAVDVLREHGVTNARVRIGRIERGLGPGPSGRGWATAPDLPEEWLEPLTSARLRDRAIAVAGREPPRIIAGDRYNVHLNLRDGQPVEYSQGFCCNKRVAQLSEDATWFRGEMLLEEL